NTACVDHQFPAVDADGTKIRKTTCGNQRKALPPAARRGEGAIGGRQYWPHWSCARLATPSVSDGGRCASCRRLCAGGHVRAACRAGPRHRTDPWRRSSGDGFEEVELADRNGT